MLCIIGALSLMSVHYEALGKCFQGEKGALFGPHFPPDWRRVWENSQSETSVVKL